ncbi:hypothetical protein [Virgibacillus necropolis]|uniref:Uncharacterized protein n=1 Tax=Virgibacillus necropolis TaxID=163877 RepID=A0A221MCN1_9BACI|nr:hypothetical protein [Virgibacillus necropolis]ASN05372.1 hypothetical protein CFK40_10280 [Virgibacillus necropolis]
MYYNDPSVKKEAKKHKKLLESFIIDPGSFRINNCDYFLVNYQRGEKITACAVVSPNSNAGKMEYLEAFNALLEFSVLTRLFVDHAGKRVNAYMYPHTLMQKFLIDVLREGCTHLTSEERNAFEYCLERINLMLELQGRIKEMYDEFEQKAKRYLDGVEENFIKQDIEEAANNLGEFGFIQYRQAVAIYEYIPKFRYIKEMNNPEVKKYITETIDGYLGEFSINEEEHRKNVERISFQPNMGDLTKEEHIEIEKSIIYKNLAEINASTRKELRL